MYRAKNVRVFLDNPSQMVTLRVLLDGASVEKSLWPAHVNASVRVPPPPQPSFLTVTVMLGKTESDVNQ